MKKFLLRSACVVALVTGASSAAYSQARNVDEGGPPARSTSAGGAKVPLIVVGSAAKATWVTTKFTTKHVAAPVAKAAFVQATPAIGKFALKNGAKYLLPFAMKLSLF